MEVIKDPVTYQLCSAPRPRDEVEASLKAFNEAVSELRIKHRIAEVVCITEATVLGEQSIATVMRRGDARLHLHLIGSVYAAIVEEQKQ